MHSRRLRNASAGCLLLAVCAALGVTANRGGSAHADSVGALRSRVQAQRAREQQLQSAIAHDSSQINQYQGSINAITARLNQLETRLASEQALLGQIQAQERAEQVKLVHLELELQRADTALAKNLVSSYEGDKPSALTVILNANGFSDLIERIEFLQRAQQQDTTVITADRAARTAVIAEAERLGSLEARQQAVTQALASQRDQVDSLRRDLVTRQGTFIRSRQAKAATLGAVSAQARQLESKLSTLLAQQAQTQNAAAGVSAGQVTSAGGFTFPLPSGAAVGPGGWSQDQGVDMAAPGNTPELAVGSGTIVLHGIGGFGAWAPVLHLDSPIGGYSYVYYGHAGPANQLPIGTHVGAGQVMSSIGPGIVGISTGPHLEIGFADASGSPVPGSSGEMLALLNASYHG